MQRTDTFGNLQRYSAAVLAAVAALLLRRLLAPVFGDQNAYHTAWLAVVFSSWYCGVGPSLITVLLNLLGVWYWFLPRTGSWDLNNPKPQISGLLGFAVFSGIIVALGESRRRSLARSQWAEDQVRRTHADLEKMVQQRTIELSRANDSLRELSSHLQELRDEERRQIARELHDSVGQLLAAVGMNNAVIQAHSRTLDAEGSRAASENASLIQQIGKEIRTMSHLLHPPLLEAAGLSSALRWYVDGFSERSKIKIKIEVPGEFPRLSDAMEITIFRLVQECLTNVHRHSGSDWAKIVVGDENDKIIVEVEDGGKGIPLEKQLELSSGRAGIGFRGMRERLRQFGGELHVISEGNGTRVRAVLPLPADAISSAERQKAS